MRIDTKLNNIDAAGERTIKYVKYFMKELNEEDLNIVYNWVDEIPLSRPKKYIYILF